MLGTFVPIGTPGRVVCVRAISSLRITPVCCTWVGVVTITGNETASATGNIHIRTGTICGITAVLRAGISVTTGDGVSYTISDVGVAVIRRAEQSIITILFITGTLPTGADIIDGTTLIVVARGRIIREEAFACR